MSEKSDRMNSLLVCEHFMGWQWIEGQHYDVSSIDNPKWLLPPGMAVANVPPGEWTSYMWRSQSKKDNRLTIYAVPRFYSDMGAAWEVLQAVMEQCLFSKRKLFWDECQKRASASKMQDSVLVAWPDAFPRLTPKIICDSALLAKGVTLYA